MKKGNVMFWKYLFLSFIVCFPVQAQENANSVSERNNYEFFIIGVAIYFLRRWGLSGIIAVRNAKNGG